MNEVELKEYLTKNLKISVSIDVNIYNEIEFIRTQLILDGKVISVDRGRFYNKNSDDYRTKGYHLYR